MDFELLLNKINSLCSDMEKIKTTVRKNMLETPGTMNIAEIMNRNYLENQNSDILSFLLNPDEKHHHPEYGSLFLESLKGSLNGTSVISIKREFSTNTKRRIDLLLETDKEFIIIENKIYAGDQYNQISDYIKSIKNIPGNKKDAFAVYLTLNGNQPSTKSIKSKELNSLSDKNKFLRISYKSDILCWLKKLETKIEENVLRAALTQYKDTIEGLTSQRKETFNMEQETSAQMLEKFGNKSRDELKECARLAYFFEKNIRIVFLVKFFEELSDNSNGKLKLVCGNLTYENKTDWENAVAMQLKDFGVRQTVNGNITKDLIVTSIDSEPMAFLFGYKADTKNEEIEKQISACGEIIQKEGYTLAIAPGSWFSNAVLAKDFQAGADWETRNHESLTEHVIKGWFHIL